LSGGLPIGQDKAIPLLAFLGPKLTQVDPFAFEDNERSPACAMEAVLVGNSRHDATPFQE
jgi:hypothetical protein